MVTVIDYGMGNVGSIVNMLRKIGVKAEVATTVEQVSESKRLILPGVGAFDTGMRRLAERGLVDALRERAEAGVPVLGICLGMQLMTKGSEEGSSPGLGWVDAHTVRFDSERLQGLRVPHMGWNDVRLLRAASLFDRLPSAPRFYFVHSFHVVCSNPEIEVARANHGYEFTAAIASGSLFGTQFHPEKSHRFGMALLAGFAGQV